MKKILLLLTALAGFALSASAGPQPEFPGGNEVLEKFLSDNIVYPAQALDMGIEGVVGVAFVVYADGSLGDVKISRMVDPDLEAEALRVVKMMPRWIPADQNGTPMDAAVNLPVKFALPAFED